MKKLLLLLLLSVASFAIEVNNNINIRGFATLDATLNTSDNIVALSPNGTNNMLVKDEINFNYSTIGFQLDLDLTDSIDIMAQAIYTKEDLNKDYIAEIPWLMLGYSFGDDYKLRVGKMKVPFMKGTEARYINYSFLWTRPQVLGKGVNGFNTLYGVDLLKKSYIKDVDLEYQLTVGKAQHQQAKDENNYLYTLSAMASYDNSWLRVSFGQTSFNKLNPQGIIQKEDVIISFASLETKLSFNSWLVHAGYANTSNSEIPDTEYLYASLAYEFNLFTPYLLYSQTNVINVPIRGNKAPPPKDGHIYENIHAVGMRYDFYQGFALKAQYNYQKNDIKDTNTGAIKKDANIYTITLDMVF